MEKDREGGGEMVVGKFVAIRFLFSRMSGRKECATKLMYGRIFLL